MKLILKKTGAEIALGTELATITGQIVKVLGFSLPRVPGATGMVWTGEKGMEKYFVMPEAIGATFGVEIAEAIE